jgi:hypothetical protein
MHSPLTSAHRYAVGFAPNPGSTGWLMGSHWLGRCAASLQPMQQLRIEGVDETVVQQLTAAPRRQGWQAPLLPAFALALGVDWLTLQYRLQQLADQLSGFHLPPLHVQPVNGALALVPAQSLGGGPTPMAQVAAACSLQLQPLAAPWPPQDAADFHFHLPLTGPLQQVDAAAQVRVFDAAQEFFAEMPALKFSSLALFSQPGEGADFMLLDHLEMGA